MKSLTVSLSAALVMSAISLSALADENNPAPKHPIHEGESFSLSADQMQFKHTGHAPLGKEILAANVYLNKENGRSATFMKFPGGFRADLHTHTEDYYGAVIKGSMCNHKKDEKCSPVPAGSYWFQKGEEPHVTECVSKEECLAIIVSSGKFDTIIIENAK